MKNKISKASHGLESYKHIITENISYKLVALFVALIFWVSILGRRDFVSTKEIEISFLTASGYSVVSQSADRIKVKVSGSQPLMKKFKDKNMNLTIDATENKTGVYEFDIYQGLIDLPSGLRILSIKPNSIKVELTEKN